MNPEGPRPEVTGIFGFFARFLNGTESPVLTADFDYSLPENLIAQHPTPSRSTSRLLVLDRSSNSLQPTEFTRLPDYLHPGDLLVLNNSRVIPARLRATKTTGGGRIELLLLESDAPGRWWTLLRPGKRVRPGTHIQLLTRDGLPAPRGMVTVLHKNDDGHCHLEFDGDLDVPAFAEAHGEMPLPPYIARPTPEAADQERYQTVFARNPGSAAAPTAGLHFDDPMLERLRAMGVETCEVTLHVGVGTFAPVKTAQVADHRMHSERYIVPEGTAELIGRARRARRRVIAVGTTSLRVLESVAREHAGEIVPGPGRTSLFLHPPADFLVADALLTNFHLPQSTLLMLVSAFASPGSTRGRPLVLEAYQRAIELGYRFFSYGDAMLVV